MTDRKANHPLFSKMLPFSRGSEWKRMRMIMNPAFSSNKLKSMEGYITECSINLTKTMCKKAKDKEQIDTKEIYGAFTLDLLAVLLFGVGIDAMTQANNPVFHHVKTVLTNTTMFKVIFMISGLFPILRTPLRLLGFTQLPKKHVDFFIESSGRILKERKINGSSRVDFLQLLINAESQYVKGNCDTKKLTSYEIIAQLALFFVAGYETTANTLQFLTHSLAGDHAIQERLVAEIEEHIGKEEPNADNLQKLKYMDAVIAETLRLYPPIPYLSRETISDCVIKGVPIEAGTGIFIPAFAIGHDAEFFPDPEKFDPERFMATDSEVNPMTYQPFGVGPRQCIGMRLALKEIKIALVYILRNLKFTHTEGIRVCPENKAILRSYPLVPRQNGVGDPGSPLSIT